MCQKTKFNLGFEYPAVHVLTWKSLPDISSLEMRTDLEGLLVIDKTERRSLSHSESSIASLAVAGRKLRGKMCTAHINKIREGNLRSEMACKI